VTVQNGHKVTAAIVGASVVVTVIGGLGAAMGNVTIVSSALTGYFGFLAGLLMRGQL
jgi:hypothetical protein